MRFQDLVAGPLADHERVRPCRGDGAAARSSFARTAGACRCSSRTCSRFRRGPYAERGGAKKAEEQKKLERDFRRARLQRTRRRSPASLLRFATPLGR